ncbi:MAG: trigger factor [Prolixibacteraceae bacterium]|jgi:trigger factor|nr:trigger factor [Prolixibacteraceae bacterium]MDI9562741.1 trigger factor [Bacteroidota bacterium]NLS99686.1 trigger factor [Bacteroidales bacterium]OQB81741.1 MAG: Trigger factor [Bacteroidetes bacterium ADurb.Bin123]HNZ67749.1 trigger factor [Prolixibacteraceae bacterium]
MKITRENTDKGYVLIRVVVEPADYEKTVADKLRDYRLKAALPGFRPGKVPSSLIHKKFAKPVIAEEVNNLLSHNLTNYLRDENMAILGDPLPDPDHQKPINWDEDKEFEFAFDVALSPDVKVDFDGKESFDYYRIKVDEKMVKENIESVRMNFGINEEGTLVEKKSSVRGDFVQLDGTGEKAEGGISAEGVLIAVDLMKDKGVKKEIVGKKAGDVLVFDPVRVFGDRHEVGHMLNISHEAADVLNSDFSFTIRSILNFKKADLNEELFKKIYGPETDILTIDQFKERLINEISMGLARSSDQKFAVDTRDQLVKCVPFDLPEAFLKRWLKEVNKEMTDEQIDKDFEGFIKDLRWQLIKNSLIREHEIGITEEEVTEVARGIAISQFRQYGIYELPGEHLESYVKKILEKEEDKDRIIRRIFEDKVIRLIREKAVVVEKEVTSEEFEAILRNNQEMEE